MGWFTRKKTFGEFVKGAVKGDISTTTVARGRVAAAGNAGVFLTALAAALAEGQEKTTKEMANETKGRGKG